MATFAAHVDRRDLAVGRVTKLGVLVLLGGLAAVAVALHLGDGSARAPDSSSIARGLVVALYVFAGTYTCWRRRNARFGLYLPGVGLLYAVGTLTASSRELPHTIGRVTFGAFLVCFAYVLLCFPYDRLGSVLERRLMQVFAASSVLLWLVTIALAGQLPPAGPLSDCGGACPSNAFRLVDAPHALTSALGPTVTGVTSAALVGVAGLLLRKAASPARLRRRLNLPLLATAAVLAVNYAAFSLLREAGIDHLSGLKVVGALTAFGVPVAMLVGQVRGQVFAAAGLGQLVGRLGGRPVTPGRVEVLLREALGDPLLQLALWEPGRAGYVDIRARPLELPARGRDVMVTSIAREGRPFAALIHDPLVDDGAGIAEGLASTALMLLENERLVEELRASRARVVASEQRERLRLERNLHDGAQQRLFALQVKVEAARDFVHDGEIGLALDEIAGDASAAVEDLRAIAHGLYPTLLRERGLADALRSLGRAAAIPVEVVDRGVSRCSTTVEEAVYFFASEAIQNAAKHAGRGARVRMTLERREGELEVMIADNGGGFSPSERPDGIGLVSMRDRIGAVGGAVEVVSRPGHGTTVRAVVPV